MKKCPFNCQTSSRNSVEENKIIIGLIKTSQDLRIDLNLVDWLKIRRKRRKNALIKENIVYFHIQGEY